MSEPVKIDQVAQGYDRLLEQFKDKPNIKSLLETYLKQTEDLESAYFELLTERSIFTAVGVQLDLLGALVVEPRLGRDDEAYRLAILTKIGINNSEGTPDVLMQLLKNLSGGTKINIFEHFPVSAVYYTNTPDIASYTPPTFEEGDRPLAEICMDRDAYKSDCFAKSLQKASPATSEDTTVIFDPEENTFLLAELGQVTDFLTDDNGNFIVDDNGNFIQVTSLQFVDDGNLDRAILTEITP